MPWTPEFQLDKSSRTISLVPEDKTQLATASATAISRLLSAAQDAGAFAKLSNWPGEKFPVIGSPFTFAIDRAIAPYFGIVTTGAQLTAFVRNEVGQIDGIWLVKRAADKPTYPGLLDNAVGGAVKHDETPFECLLREASEELGLVAEAAVPAGTVSWFNIKDSRSGLASGLVEPGVQYVYDLEVSPEVELRPEEPGIEWVKLLSVEETKAALKRYEFKPSCAIVMIDFFVRHGMINAENDTHFAEMIPRLHRALPLPVI
ncbi:hypothetical protein V2A60_000731 [Cordyceps javanica]|uniref:Thiamine pyrophosphokinase n=1 Tax=Cordyceps javanica TaxID=43265 RepID=A0A545V1G1_9HYPO|nr:thiamine pyrophosphokinase [Cordyceps javanica]TQW07258.1 thiamine pyrophosphokinase [Cordyceps javanica]